MQPDLPRARRIAAPAAAVLVLGAVSAVVSGTGTAHAATAPTATKIAVHKIGTSQVSAGTNGELRPPMDDDVAAEVKAVANRSPHSRARKLRTTTGPSGITPTQTLAVNSAPSGFAGLNHYDQRTADGGNQYSLVPPDQALCTNGTQIFEGVNNAFRVYDTGGSALSPTYSANQFLFGDHEINRSTGVASPHDVGDPSCVYDAGSQRFFLTVYDLVEDGAGNLQGPSYVDIAVSPKGSALGTWSVYQMDTTDDGTNGTPSHPACPCFGDYPHLGTDANGLYITTNEYPTLNDGANAAQVYAISKTALAAGTADIPGAHFDTARSDYYQGVYYDGFTLAPALSAGTDYAPKTMYFLSSDAWSGDNPIVSKQVLLWKLTNTDQLASDPSALRLTNTAVATNAYTVPPASDQKAGSVPLADCLNTTACAKVVLGTPDKYKEYEYAFDSSDTRMLQAAYAHGQVWGALDTAVDVAGATKAGVAYYVVNPTSNTLTKQGTLAVAGNNISYPALGVTSAGRAAMALTLTGADYFPSSAYVTLNDVPGTPASAVQVNGAGLGPDDDFSGYRGFEYNRPRWGDYGAASVVGNQVYLASEYINQTCTLTQYEASPFGTCGNTRTALANWATHIGSVTP